MKAMQYGIKWNKPEGGLAIMANYRPPQHSMGLRKGILASPLSDRFFKVGKTYVSHNTKLRMRVLATLCALRRM